jgi:hypothetical protein
MHVVWNISPRLATVALVALVALDVALVATALRSTEASGIDTSPVSTASASTDPGLTDPTASVSSSPSTPITAVGAPLQTMLVALDDQRAWRVGAGSCSGGGATLATTIDGGKTWAKGKADLRRIVRVRPTDNRAAFIVGANANCAATLKDTTDGGSTWTSGASAGGAWFRDPKNPVVVWAPGSARSQPCGRRSVLDLVVLTTGSARVLCGDGLVRSTTDNGSAWTDVGRVEGAVALAASTVTPAETYVARVGVPQCAGVQILRVRQRVATSCIKASIPRDPGQISMSLVKGGGWLSVGDATMRSTDGLVTWTVS